MERAQINLFLEIRISRKYHPHGGIRFIYAGETHLTRCHISRRFLLLILTPKVNTDKASYVHNRKIPQTGTRRGAILSVRFYFGRRYFFIARNRREIYVRSNEIKIRNDFLNRDDEVE